MVLGDVVVRNPQYVFCICGTRPGCWCRAGGDWRIVGTKIQASSQSGTMVEAELNGKKTDWIDSSHFIHKAQGELFPKG